MAAMDSSPDTATPAAAVSAEQPSPENRVETDASASEYVPAHRTVIEPARGWQFINAAELWHNRELLFFLIWRDVKVRYKQTLLGAAWAILQPLTTMIVLTFVFGRMANMAENVKWPYPIFSFAGVLPWTFFSIAVSQSGNSVVGSERLITKIYFPRLAIPFAAVGAAVVDFAIAFGILIALMVWYHIAPTFQMLWVFPLMMIISLLALGMGTLLAALNVAYRDVRYIIPFMMQIWMYATPTIYMQLQHETGENSLGRAHFLLFANPMTGLIMAFRAAVLGAPMPWNMLVINGSTALLLFFFGCLYFRKVEDSFADKI